MPLAWLVFSIAYLLFSLTIEERRMPGGDWDPGSAALPTGVAVVMIACSAYLVLKENVVGARDSKKRRAVNGESSPGETRGRLFGATERLIIMTVLLLSAYVLSFRTVGFVITTTVMLLMLTYFYSLGDVRWEPAFKFAKPLGLTTVFTVLVFHLGVTALRWTRYFGRIWELDLLRSRPVSALIGLVLWAVLLLPMFLYIRPKLRRRREAASEAGALADAAQHRALSRAMILSVITTLALYLVFQQLFRVALPMGVLG